MKKEILELFKKIGCKGNCGVLANDLVIGMTEMGYFTEIKRVFHKLNVFGENSLYCEHICGENYAQHFVVNYNGFTFDSKLDSPVPSDKYLKKAYHNYNDLKMS